MILKTFQYLIFHSIIIPKAKKFIVVVILCYSLKWLL